MHPVNLYGAARAATHQVVAIYRARSLHCSSQMLSNHESPRRPHRFVTRRIAAGVAAIAAGRAQQLTRGNLAVQRDWGCAPHFTRAMLLAAQTDEPDDYVVATGKSHSLTELIIPAFASDRIADWTRYVYSDRALLRQGLGRADQLLHPGARSSGLGAHGRLPGDARGQGGCQPGGHCERLTRSSEQGSPPVAIGQPTRATGHERCRVRPAAPQPHPARRPRAL